MSYEQFTEGNCNGLCCFCSQSEDVVKVMVLRQSCVLVEGWTGEDKYMNRMLFRLVWDGSDDRIKKDERMRKWLFTRL